MKKVRQSSGDQFMGSPEAAYEPSFPQVGLNYYYKPKSLGIYDLYEVQMKKSLSSSSNATGKSPKKFLSNF